MRKISIIGAAALALVFACSKENDSKLSEPREVTLTASIPQTKATVDDAGVFTWQEGDKIGVYVEGKTTPVAFDLSEGAGTGTGKFKGTVTADLTGYAVYPYNAETTLSGTTLTVKLPHTVDYNNQKATAVMLAKNVTLGGNIEFKQLGSLFKITYYEVPSNAKYFRFTTYKSGTIDGADISGTSTVDVSAENPVMSPATGTNNQKNFTVNIPDEGLAKGSMSFYIPVAPGTYPFQVSMRKDGYGTLSRTEKIRSTPFTAEQGGLYILPDVRVIGLFTFENSNDLNYYKLSGNSGALSVVDNPAPDAVNPSAKVLMDNMTTAGSTSGYFQFSSPWSAGEGQSFTIKMYMGENEYYPYLQINNKRHLPTGIDGVTVTADSESECAALLWGEGKNKWHLLEYSASSFSDAGITKFTGSGQSFQFRPFSIAGAASAAATNSETNNKIAYFDDFEMKQ